MGQSGGRNEAATVEISELPSRGVLGAIDGDDGELFGSNGFHAAPQLPLARGQRRERDSTSILVRNDHGKGLL